MREGLHVAIVGAPNVGKSTLLNALAKRDVAIVSPYAGTTRDVLEVHLDLGGYPVTLIDTAGLRTTADPVEQEGIRRAQARASDADLVLWLDDAGFATPSPVTASQLWRVATKVDATRTGPSEFSISARTGEGVDGLVAGLARFAEEALAAPSGLITRTRHRVLLGDAEAALAHALAETEPELIAEALRRASFALGRLLGKVDVEDILGSIFGRFCIGK
jgi:tRNA modification GTPase